MRSQTLRIKMVACVGLASSAAFGQAFSTGFEAPTYSGSATGVALNGQDAWYLPAAGGETGNVFTYAGNTHSIVANAQGGSQFAVMLNVLNNGRSQHPVNFSAGGEWEAQWDCLGAYVGTLPAVNYLGSFSLQDSVTSRYFQQLMSFSSNGGLVLGPNGETPTDYLATADHFHIALGVHLTAPYTAIAFRLPSMTWADLPVNNWYRIKVRWTFDPAGPKILSASIQDLTAGGPAQVTDLSSLNWYLAGGPGNTRPLPTDIRIFAGGSTAAHGHLTAWDNLTIGPVTAGGCYANCDNSTTTPVLNVADFTCFLQRYAAGESYANCDNSTTPPVLNVADFTCFLQQYAAGCP
jgi:hypothetical protein